MPISKHKVGYPVLAQIDEVTAESIPPETPTTKPFIFDFLMYFINQSSMYWDTFLMPSINFFF